MSPHLSLSLADTSFCHETAIYNLNDDNQMINTFCVCARLQAEYLVSTTNEDTRDKRSIFVSSWCLNLLIGWRPELYGGLISRGHAVIHATSFTGWFALDRAAFHFDASIKNQIQTAWSLKSLTDAVWPEEHSLWKHVAEHFSKTSIKTCLIYFMICWCVQMQYCWYQTQ